MNIKHLSQTSIAGLFLIAFAPSGFAEPELEKTQQQQRQQIQSREHMPSEQSEQQREMIRNRIMSEEQKKLHQQRQIQDRARQSNMGPKGGKETGVRGGGRSR
ncbi:MAG: hypothetical protein ISR72_04855 [Methylobacter sp.]|nr:hypothetical protein [Methylobacter sp.]